MANDKIAIIGTRGCGKTVLLAVLTHRFKAKTERGYQIIPDNLAAVQFTSEKWGDLTKGEWPAPTPPLTIPPIFQWKLCKGKKSKLMTTADIAGEAWQKFILDSVNASSLNSKTERSNWEKIKAKWADLWNNQQPPELVEEHLKTVKELLNQSSGIFLLLNLKEIINKEQDYEMAMYLPVALANYMSSIKRQHIPVTLVLTQTDQYSFEKEKMGTWEEVVKDCIPWMPPQFKNIIPTAAVGAVTEKIIDDIVRSVPASGFPSQGLEELYENLWDTMSKAEAKAWWKAAKHFFFIEVPILFILWIIYVIGFIILTCYELVWGLLFCLIGAYAFVKIANWLRSKR